MRAKADTGSAPESVVQRYMAAVMENNRSDAEKLLASLHVGYPQYGERDDRPPGRGGFDWFHYFRDRGFVLSETTMTEMTGIWATVEARCLVPGDPGGGTHQLAIFRVFREQSSWLISDISLSLDADVRHDGP